MTNLSKLKSLFREGVITKPDFIQQALAQHQTLFDYVQVVASTDVNEIRITSDGVRFILGKEAIQLYCPPDEARVAPLEVMNFDSYEPEETSVMDRLVVGAENILDIGANIGWYTSRFAKRMPEARIYAFEPMPTSFAYLQRNIAANSLGARVTAFNYGLSNTCGSVEFFLSPAQGTNASLKNVSASSEAVSVMGLTLTLDQWVANFRVVPHFIKCDVEGAELLVFQGASNTLKVHRPIVFAELLRKWSKAFGYHPNDMLKHFADLGYCCFAVGSNGTRLISEVTESTLETNYAFLHNQTHAGLIAELGEVQ